MKEATSISSPNASTRSSPSPENDSPVFNLLSPSQQLATQKKVLDELNSHIKRKPKGQRYSDMLKKIALTLFLISPAAYLFVTQFLPIMSTRTVQRSKQKMIGNLKDKLMSLSNINEIIDEYTEDWPDNSEAILAVDACSVTPSLALYSNQTIISFTSKYQITKEQLELVSSNNMVFEEWLRMNSHLMIKALFVFQVQPLSPSIEPFYVHVFPSNNGKANEHILFLLDQISAKLKEKSINIIGFASDGDSFISQGHDKNIEKHYVSGLYKSIDLENQIVISDLLHVLKRSRYHMIKAMTNLITKTQIINFCYLLNLPSMVFKDDLSTKMHDMLQSSIV